jgi:hypothetical protein
MLTVYVSGHNRRRKNVLSAKNIIKSFHG